VALLSCSVGDLTLTGKECPCTAKYVCDVATNLCVAVGGASEAGADAFEAADAAHTAETGARADARAGSHDSASGVDAPDLEDGRGDGRTQGGPDASIDSGTCNDTDIMCGHDARGKRRELKETRAHQPLRRASPRARLRGGRGCLRACPVRRKRQRSTRNDWLACRKHRVELRTSRPQRFLEPPVQALGLTCVPFARTNAPLGRKLAPVARRCVPLGPTCAALRDANASLAPTCVPLGIRTALLGHSWRHSRLSLRAARSNE
jgi:hypothetical protein